LPKVRGKVNGHVFISYSHKERAYVHDLADDLRRHGFDVWADDRIDYGDSWWRKIVQAIRDSAAFVVVMTPAAEDSEWVQREILLALRERKPIFPLLLRGSELSLLVTMQYVDVTGDRMPPESFYDRLREVVFYPPPVADAAGPDMILIPAGRFLMGSEDGLRFAQDNEKPQHVLKLPRYYIAKTSVTNAQYAVFVQETDGRRPTHWGSEYGHPPIGKETHPVVYVSWGEAMDYCDWLSDVTGTPYRLPTEAEWEKAARGVDGLKFPWGNRWNSRWCNSAVADWGDTRPVGSYRKGASPYGVLDMAGNVWEWTLSLWGTDPIEPDFSYPYNPNDGRENQNAGGGMLRILRGGSFTDVAGDVRCAVRHGHLPYCRFQNVGFRVAASRF
jgi:formylglycine-generating enzyme required for sulfatase activity